MSYTGYPGSGYQPPPPSGDLMQLRARQIESLRSYLPQTREVERGSVFETPIAIPGRSVSLRM